MISTVYNVNFDYLRPKKAEVLKEWYNNDFSLKEDVSSVMYPQATILPLKKLPGDQLLFGRGGVLSKDKVFIKESGIEDRVFGAYDFSECVSDDSRVVYCGYMSKHWGHFLVESVSRLWYFLTDDNTIDKYIFFVGYDENYELKGNYKEFFELLGIADKIEIINKPTCYREVVVPELGYKRRRYYSQLQKDVFRKISENIRIDACWEKYEKIYFTRSQFSTASKPEFGLDMIDDFYEKNGFYLVAPEKISLSHMIYLINNAIEISTVSGTLPHNILFADDNKKLTIIERNVLNNEIQVDINIIKKAEVTYIDASFGIYPVYISEGPFLLMYHGMLKKYSQDKGYKSVDEKFLTKKALKKYFCKYMKAYKKLYCYQWVMGSWYIPYCGYIREAYEDSFTYFGDYLSGNLPFRWYHYFQIRYIKRLIRRILR